MGTTLVISLKLKFSDTVFHAARNHQAEVVIVAGVGVYLSHVVTSRQRIQQGCPCKFVSRFVHHNNRLNPAFNFLRQIRLAPPVPARRLGDTLRRWLGWVMVTSNVMK